MVEDDENVLSRRHSFKAQTAQSSENMLKKFRENLTRGLKRASVLNM